MTLEEEETSGIAGETTFEEETATTSSGATLETTPSETTRIEKETVTS